jgi:hypothetical protein
VVCCLNSGSETVRIPGSRDSRVGERLQSGLLFRLLARPTEMVNVSLGGFEDIAERDRATVGRVESVWIPYNVSGNGWKGRDEA